MKASLKISFFVLVLWYYIAMSNMIIISARSEEIQQKKNFALRRASNLSGELGLIAAIISRATLDYCFGNERESESAAAYFMGKAYADHLSWLDLPPDWLPELLEDAANVAE